MALERMTFTTPVGRFVSGSLTEKRTKDNQGNPIAPEKQRFEFGLAVRKDDPQIGAFIGQIAQNAKAQYAAKAPHIVPRIDAWFQSMSGFAMKISDGDAPNLQGRRNENTAGCFVLWFSTSLDIIAARVPDNAQIPLSQIKRGFYVDVYGSTSINEKVDHTAGLYLNPQIVRLVAEGDEIVSQIDPAQAFAGMPPPSAAHLPGARPIGTFPAQAPMAAPGLPGMVAPQMPGQMPAAAPPTGMPMPGYAAPAAPPTGMPMPGQMPGPFGGAAPIAAAPVATGFAPSPGIPTASPSNPQYPPYTGAMVPGQR